MALRRTDQDDITWGKTYRRLMDPHQAPPFHPEDIETARSLNSGSHQSVRQPHRRIRMISHWLAVQLSRSSSIELVQHHPSLFMFDQHEAALALGETTYLPPPDHGSFNDNSIRSPLSYRRLGRRRNPHPFNRYRLHLATH
ncbi:hypothetical protein ASE52_21980 [Acidovorax sp. Root275]|nr:hypothetical protein ASE52_21980 [Acidovorax sp. Root275]